VTNLSFHTKKTPVIYSLIKFGMDTDLIIDSCCFVRFSPLTIHLQEFEFIVTGQMSVIYRR